MRRLLSTRFGFFAFAALVCWAMLLVIESEHRWLAFALGCLYALLSIGFYFEDAGKTRPRVSRRSDEPLTPVDPPPPPG